MSPVSKKGNAWIKRKYACVECRQQKSKCDYDGIGTNPCSNCAKNDIHCTFKKDFKRLSKRANTADMERKVSYITSHLMTNGDMKLNDLYYASTTSHNDTNKLSNFNELNNLPMSKFDNTLLTKEQLDILKLEARNPNFIPTIPSNAQYPKLNTPNTTILSPDKLECTPKVLGDISMESAEIADLFQEYASKYHQFLPIVDLSNGVESLYKLSPCLFWVIILTALRHKSGSFGLLTKLSSLVKSVLAEITISPIIRYTPTETDEPLLNVASVYSVQAFLIYTFWPPLTSSLSADTSWSTSGTAMFQAIRVGLNSAKFSKEYPTTNPALINDQIKTWTSCNIVSQIVASLFGFPSYVSFGHGQRDPTGGKCSYTNNVNSDIVNSDIVNINNANELLPELRQMEQIVHFEKQVQTTLHSNPDNRLGLVDAQEKIPLIMVLSQQLDQLESSLTDSNNGKVSIDNIRYFQLLLARVHLLTYFFIGDTVDKINFESERGLVKAYNAAIALLEHTQIMCNDNSDIIKYFPGVFVLSIWQSSCIVSKLVHSGLNDILDVRRGRIAYQHAIQLTSKASITEYDTAYRFSGIMKSIWNMLKIMFEKEYEQQTLSSDFNLTLTIKSRMSASVFFDCLYILKEKCNAVILERKRIHIDCDENVEDDARRIIRTTPLDPSPINASSSGSKQSSGLSSPIGNTEAHPHDNLLSLENILNGTSPVETRKSKAGLERIAAIKSASMPPSFIPPPPLLASNHSERNQTPNTNGSSILVENTWNTGGFDVNLKDLDLLLNDFAFNPSL